MFVPNGNSDRPHHGATLLALRGAGAGAAGMVLFETGHESKWNPTLQNAGIVPSNYFFVTVKIAGGCAGGIVAAMAELTDSTTTVAELKARVLAFVQARDWEQFHSPKNLSMALAAETGELMEHFLWATPEQSQALAADPAKRAKIADELADVVVYALEFANITGIDVAAAIETKMRANALKYPVEKARGRADKYTEL